MQVTEEVRTKSGKQPAPVKFTVRKSSRVNTALQNIFQQSVIQSVQEEHSNLSVHNSTGSTNKVVVVQESTKSQAQSEESTAKKCSKTGTTKKCPSAPVNIVKTESPKCSASPSSNTRLRQPGSYPY